MRQRYAILPRADVLQDWNFRLAKLHHKSSLTDSSVSDLASAIEQFLAACKRPAALEQGEELVELTRDTYAIEIRAGRLWFESYSEDRAISRRIISILERKPGLLECGVHRFANPPGRLSFFDLDRPATSHRTIAGHRRNFGERFRRMLTRQFPGWQMEQLSASLDLQRSFSAVYPRAKLSRGLQTVVAVACPAAELESGCLTAALLWFDYQRRRARPGSSHSLVLFLPEGAGSLSAQRLKWLRAQPLHTRVFLFNEHGAAGEVDPDDLGNIDTRVAGGHTAPGDPPATSGKLEIALEAAVRRNLETVDATLLADYVHRQVLTFAACERNLIDLLTVDTGGRLCIVELKAAEDLQLPLQALDYWMRIRWHASRGQLTPLFPGLTLSSQAPRLLLVAPASAFHPTNRTVLSYFSPEIDVQRIGVNSDWNRRLTVVMRLTGAHAPISHETDCHVDSRPHPHS
jgi:hypothetical protein